MLAAVAQDGLREDQGVILEAVKKNPRLVLSEAGQPSPPEGPLVLPVSWDGPLHKEPGAPCPTFFTPCAATEGSARAKGALQESPAGPEMSKGAAAHGMKFS